MKRAPAPSQQPTSGLFPKLLAMFMLLVCVLLASPGQGRAAADAERVRILIVHAYSQEYAWTAGQHRGFVDALNAGVTETPHIDAEYLNTKERTLDPAYAEAYAALMARKYEKRAPTAIYVTDDNGYRFAIGYLRPRFPRAPIFFSGVNDFNVLKTMDRTFTTGVFERQDIVRNLDLLVQLVPRAKKIAVIGDGSSTFTAIQKEIERDIAGTKRSIPIDIVSADSLDSFVSLFTKQPDEPIVLTTIGGIKDRNGHVLAPRETVSGIRQVSRGPIITMEGGYMVSGVQGGYVTSAERQGEAAAKLVLDWLKGAKFPNIEPVTDSPNEFVFNGTEMENSGLQNQSISKARRGSFNRFRIFSRKTRGCF